MAKPVAPRMQNPATPKAPRVLTPVEAEEVLTAPDTNDSDVTDDEQAVMDEVFGEETEEEEYETSEDTEEEGDDEIEDKPTKPAVVKAAKSKAGGNLNAEQQKYWDEIGALGRDQGKGISSLISVAEKVTYIGANGTFETKQLKGIYMWFRKNSNTAAGKNAEVGEEDHTVVSNTSKLRNFYKVGEKFGVDGWSKMLKVARDIHVSILRDKEGRKLFRSKQLVPTYEALVKVASQQMSMDVDQKTGVKSPKYPSLMTADQIRDVYIDPDKKEVEPSVKDVIDAAAKAIERVIRGKVNPTTHEVSREPFEFTGNPDVDDNSTAYGLKSSLDWILQAGERYQKGYIANREKEIAEAKAAADERKRKADERKAKEIAEAAAKKAAKEAEAKRRAAEAALAKEGAAAK